MYIPNTKGFNNSTPLDLACCGGHLELVEKLINDYRCDPMARDGDGLLLHLIMMLHFKGMNRL